MNELISAQRICTIHSLALKTSLKNVFVFPTGTALLKECFTLSVIFKISQICHGEMYFQLHFHKTKVLKTLTNNFEVGKD